jgi:hypothetical protein
LGLYSDDTRPRVQSGGGESSGPWGEEIHERADPGGQHR